MKYLSILLALVIMSCSSSTEPEQSIYPLVFKTWTVTDSNNANWDGISAKSKTDTLIYDEAGEIILTIQGLERDPSYFSISLTDSSKSSQDSISWFSLWDMPTEPNGVSPYHSQGTTGIGGADFITYIKDLSYNCDPSTVIDSSFIQVRIVDNVSFGNDTTYEVIKLNVDGIKETIQHIVCY